LSYADIANMKIKNVIITDTGGTTSGTKQDFIIASPSNATAGYNLSSDASAADDGVTGNVLINKTSAAQFVSTAGGSEDLHLKSSADARNRGTDLATTPTGVQYDIDNYDRDTNAVVWDIGADEYTAGADGSETVSGTVYSNEGVTALGNQTVQVAINGTNHGTTAESNATTGAYSITDLTLAAGNVITVYLQEEPADAVTVTVSDGFNLPSGVDLYQDRLIVRQDNGGSLTNANLSTAVVADETDISNIYSVSGTLTVASGKALYIWPGHTFAPADALDLNGNLTISSGSTLDGTSANINLAGNWSNSGTFTHGNNTVTLDGTTQTVSDNSTFYNLTHSVAAADTLTFDNTGTQTIASGGTLTLNGASANLLTLASDSTPNQWSINVHGNYALNYLDVGDSDASGGATLVATNSIQTLSNNTNWIIEAGATTWERWDGSESGVWTLDGNWADGTAPTDASKCLVDGNYTNAPTITADDTIGSLIVSGTAILTIGNTATLTVTNDIEIWDGAKITFTQNEVGDLTCTSGTLTVYNGGTLSCPYTDLTTQVSGVTVGKGRTITAANIDIQSGGTIEADADGFAGDDTGGGGGDGPGGGAQAANEGAGGGYGGPGGLAWKTDPASAGGSPYGTAASPVALGSGGGGYKSSGTHAGGDGGGAIKLSISGTLTINGTLSADGQDGSGNFYAGGGSGGSIWIDGSSITLAGSGTISAKGGDDYCASASYAGGGGGGGRIDILDVAAASAFFTGGGTIDVSGGSAATSCGAQNGSAGTIKFPASLGLIVDNSGATGLKNLTLGLNYESSQVDETLYDFDSVTVATASTLTLSGNPQIANGGQGVTISAPSMTITGTVTANGQGFGGSINNATGDLPSGMGPGTGGLVASNSGGSGHGGAGGASGGASAGATYGSLTVPVTLGSPGNAHQGGGTGGGGIKLSISGTLTVNGTLSADGTDGTGATFGSGGSGGSIYLDVDTLAGSGAIHADAGDAYNGSYNSGGSGGGRIALYYDTANSFTLTTAGNVAKGATDGSGAVGADGTVYIEGATGTFVWQGDDATSPTDWHTPANWDLNVVPNGSSANVTIPNAASDDPTISTAAVTVGTLAIESNRTLTCQQNLTAASNVDCDGTLDITNKTFTVAGNLDFTNGTLTETGSTIIFNGTTTLTSASEALNNVQLGTASLGGTLTLDDQADIDGTFSVLDGAATTLDLTNKTLLFGGPTFNLTNLDTLTNTGSTVNFDSTAAQTITSDASNGPKAYNNLTVSNSNASGASFADAFTTANFTNTTADSNMFQNSATYTINSALTLTGLDSQLIVLDTIGTDTPNFTFNVTGSVASADYLNVDHANADGMNIETTNSTDGGNNNSGTPTYNWVFAVAHLRVTGTATMTTDDTNELTVTAYNADGSVDTTYAGSKSLTFSGPGDGPDGTVPSIEGTNIGTAQNVTFANGVSASNTLTLTACLVQSTTVDVTDGTLDSTYDATYDLDLNVTVGAANKLLFDTEHRALLYSYSRLKLRYTARSQDIRPV
jgi:hypothetical protein